MSIELNTQNIPGHIAIIMDGNGRWANTRGLPRIAGHREGVRAVRRVTELCGELDVNILTLYTFSSENWKRPATEVSALMKLLVNSLRKEVKDLMKNNVRFTVIGNIEELEQNVRRELEDAIEKTARNTGLNLNLALSYGSRQEIIRAARYLAEISANGEMSPGDITEELFSKHLYTNAIPDPDLLIRTGGEFRISNFLLWQIAYTEIYVTDTFWPEFGKTELDAAILEYQSRERRFGKISEQLQANNR
ncbi:MAG: isoprenyl transferase [Candidatus Marinimicrobia bacterium]|nr:isoprenyl transferase [Candidatus Neomarinimicrobiota bacterium]MDP6936565.1 isoprenyl transferase [Candidatus Neomarinimicrobiota bacterium]